MKDLLITGGSGFVGRHLKKRLESRSKKYIEYDLACGKDIVDWARVKSLRKVSTVVHLAAKSFVPESYKRPREFYHANILGTLNALEYCRKRDSRLIYLSSYVYGVPRYLPIDEKHPVDNFNPYASSKIASELLCESYAKHFGVPVAIIRPFNLYGPGQNPRFLINTIIRGVMRGVVKVHDLRPKRDYLFIDDFIALLEKVIDEDSWKNVKINAGFGESFSVRSLIDNVSRIIGKKPKILCSNEKRSNEVSDTVCDNTLAGQLFHWHPVTGIAEGIRMTITSDHD